MPAPMLQLVWFKRDLRLDDHPALTEAARYGPVLPLFVVEPGYWAQRDISARHWQFCLDSLADLQQQLGTMGIPLLLRKGELTNVLAEIKTFYGQFVLWSHEETGNDWTFGRDRKVAAWCREQGIHWQERPQNGVVRRLGNRDHWADHWERRMQPSTLPVPDLQPPSDGPTSVPLSDLAPENMYPVQQQPGGRRAGLRCLDSFLTNRGRDYRFAMSSPNTAYAACSRLSPHLCWGTLSVREVYQAAHQALEQAEHTAWQRSLRSFISRLYWHCHFMQKLEDRPSLEWAPIHPLFDELDRAPNSERLERWASGLTGWPFVDACMRALNARGWINFRMRAMLTSVASYHLWLPWQDSGQVLARAFIDYEPGIHWSQIQMQSGTTGINAIRVYNPLKQGLDLDPDGLFMRRWLPELAEVPLSALHEPRLLRQARYPAPMVDLNMAARSAKDKVAAIHHHPRFDELSRAVYQQLGSRKRSRRASGRRTNRRTTSATPHNPQLSLWD
ncbi:FAD-binding domain-containing protein [Marinobacterium weihaiense]|uniref:Deoxyribodipyrimidine photo-lyase n=1 Tax=Marinobacterium weihaiense TaxID=2851016 RepID=A0ABS6MAZ5_9GAMM|nr:FAD-binding domain-containing protein [Marinobacterium weihaiense]MBV0932912.1 deoxyribodipyrimidine photo-lyase [Marinobacterium weihaiense]